MGLREEIKAARMARKMSQGDLARAVGISQVAVKKIESGETRKSRFLPEIAHFLGLPLDAEVRPAGIVETVRRSTVADHIPLFAAAEGGPGELLMSREPIDQIDRPAQLANTTEGYAVYVVGESMVPAFEPGDVAIVHPRQPLVPQAYCIFYTNDPADDRASIKRLVKATPYTWTVMQHNPEKTFELDRGDWPICHRVVTKNFRL